MQSAARSALGEIEKEFKHSERLKRALQNLNLHLPYGATPDDREEARELAAEAVKRLPIGASDAQISSAISRVIGPIRTRIETREAEKERQKKQQQQEASHRNSINEMVSLVSLSLNLQGASDDERESGKAQARAALEQLPVGASYNQMQTAREKALAPIEIKIRERAEAARVLQEAERQKEEKRRQQEWQKTLAERRQVHTSPPLKTT